MLSICRCSPIVLTSIATKNSFWRHCRSKTLMNSFQESCTVCIHKINNGFIWIDLHWLRFAHCRAMKSKSISEFSSFLSTKLLRFLTSQPTIDAIVGVVVVDVIMRLLEECECENVYVYIFEILPCDVLMVQPVKDCWNESILAVREWFRWKAVWGKHNHRAHTQTINVCTHFGGAVHDARSSWLMKNKKTWTQKQKDSQLERMNESCSDVFIN